MKATGIVRRIDDLGRIVIPKEIRKTLKVKEGMPLEIYTDQEGGITLKKYLPFSEFASLAEEYAECMVQQTGATAVITDREKVIAAAGNLAKNFKGEAISSKLERILDDRDELLPAQERNRYLPITNNKEEEGSQVYAVIRSGGEIVGAVFLQTFGDNRKIGELEKKVVSIAAEFLGRQINV